MLNVGWGEMALVLVVALVVFGPNRLPEVARSMGKFVRQFQRETSRAMSDLKEGLEPINVGIFDEPDAVATDPVGAGAVEPVADMPATTPPAASSRQLATTRRKTSTPPARRAAATRSRTTASARASSAKTGAKRSAAKSPARRASGTSKPRRRA